jgi:hypothetical protein
MRKYKMQHIGHWKKLFPMKNYITPHKGCWRKVASMNKYNAQHISHWKKNIYKRICGMQNKGKSRNMCMRS